MAERRTGDQQVTGWSRRGVVRHLRRHLTPSPEGATGGFCFADVLRISLFRSGRRRSCGAPPRSVARRQFFKEDDSNSSRRMTPSSQSRKNNDAQQHNYKGSHSCSNPIDGNTGLVVCDVGTVVIHLRKSQGLVAATGATHLCDSSNTMATMGEHDTTGRQPEVRVYYKGSRMKFYRRLDPHFPVRVGLDWSPSALASHVPWLPRFKPFTTFIAIDSSKLRGHLISLAYFATDIGDNSRFFQQGYILTR